MTDTATWFALMIVAIAGTLAGLAIGVCIGRSWSRLDRELEANGMDPVIHLPARAAQPPSHVKIRSENS